MNINMISGDLILLSHNHFNKKTILCKNELHWGKSTVMYALSCHFGGASTMLICAIDLFIFLYCLYNVPKTFTHVLQKKQRFSSEKPCFSTYHKYKPCTNLPFKDCGMHSDHQVILQWVTPRKSVGMTRFHRVSTPPPERQPLGALPNVLKASVAIVENRVVAVFCRFYGRCCCFFEKMR